MRRLVVLVALVLALPSCVGSGSEVGPQLPDLPEGSVSGVVMTPAGEPVCDAQVNLGTRLTFTDSHGRFRFQGNEGGAGLLKVDGTRTTTTTPPGAILDSLAISIAFEGGNALVSAAVILPDFRAGASATISVNQGAALAGVLVDPATGAQLDLAGAVATLPDVTATSTTIRFVSVAPDLVSKALTVGGVVRAGALYFAIAPSDLVFTTSPTVRVSDATFGIAAAIAGGKTVTPELDELNASGTWSLEGPATIGGGLLTSSAITSGGMHSISVACPTANRTIVTAQTTDRDFNILPRVGGLCRDGRSAGANGFGNLTIQDVCAADANDAPIAVPLLLIAPAYFAQHTFRRDALPGVPGVGMQTAFGGRPLATTASGQVRVLPIFRGVALPGGNVGVSSWINALADLSGTSTTQGADIWDVPNGTFQVAVTKLLGPNLGVRGFAFGSFPGAGTSGTCAAYPLEIQLVGSAQSGFGFGQAQRKNSRAVATDVFGMIGIDGLVAQQAFASTGLIQYNALLPGAFLSTMGRGNQLSGAGTAFDLVERTSYSTIATTCELVRHEIDYDLDLSPTGFAAAAEKKGAVTGLTDPAATPPTSGAYTAQVLSNETQSFEGRISVALGMEPEPGGTMPPKAIAPTFASPSYDAFTPAGVATVTIVERDAVGVLGPITRLGFVASTTSTFGTIQTLPVNLNVAPSDVASASFDGVVGNPAAVRASMILELGGGLGVSCGDQGSFTFTPSGPGFSAQVNVPPFAAAPVPTFGIKNAAIVLSNAGLTASGSPYVQSAAAVLGPGAAGHFLTIPEIAAPAPPPGQPFPVSPTSTGIAWASDPATDETVLTLERTAVIVNGAGKSVAQQFLWTVRLPTFTPSAPPSSFVFPSLPQSSGGTTVAPFFTSGGTYVLTIEAHDYVSYVERAQAPSSDIVTPAYFQPRSSARTQITIQIP